MRKYYIKTNFKLMYWIYVAALKLTDYRLDIQYCHVKRELDETLLNGHIINPRYMIGSWSKEVRINASHSYTLREPFKL